MSRRYPTVSLLPSGSSSRPRSTQANACSARPWHASQPRLLKALDLGQGSGPHYIALTEDEKRLVISDYFLNEDNFGKVHAEGDHKIHVATVTRDDLILDSKFNLDFNSAFPTGPARPHGIAIK